jgi:hypothetical protein
MGNNVHLDVIRDWSRLPREDNPEDHTKPTAIEPANETTHQQPY